MKKRVPKTSKADAVAAIALLLFSIWYGIEAWSLPKMRYMKVIEAYVFPLGLALLLNLLSLILLYTSLRGGRGTIKKWLPPKHVIGQIIFLLVSLSIYIVLFQTLGYFTSTLLFVLGVLRVLERKRPFFSSILLSILLSGICYVIFAIFLGIPMPRGILI